MSGKASAEQKALACAIRGIQFVSQAPGLSRIFGGRESLTFTLCLFFPLYHVLIHYLLGFQDHYLLLKGAVSILEASERRQEGAFGKVILECEM